MLEGYIIQGLIAPKAFQPLVFIKSVNKSAVLLGAPLEAIGAQKKNLNFVAIFNSKVSDTELS